MIIYPVEFQRRLEQKWGRRIDQIIAVTAARHRREIPTMTMITRMKAPTTFDQRSLRLA